MNTSSSFWISRQCEDSSKTNWKSNPNAKTTVHFSYIVVLPKLVLVRLSTRLASTSNTSSHTSPIRIQKTPNPLIRYISAFQFISALQVCRCTQQSRLKVDVYSLVHALRSFKYFMHETDMFVLRKRTIPPLPGFHVEWAVRICVDVFDASPVADCQRFDYSVCIFASPACLSENFITVSQEFDTRDT